MTYKCIVLFSGGKDSTVCLWWARNEFGKPLALSFNYEGRPHAEISAARELCYNNSVPIKEIDLPFMSSVGYRLKNGLVKSRKDGFIPQRNIIFYSIAVYFASLYRCDTICGGHVATDSLAHLDSTKEFFDHFERCSRFGHTDQLTPLRIILPLAELSDFEVVMLGRRLGAPIDQTWSCWEDRPAPCGECVSCLDRERAFRG